MTPEVIGFPKMLCMSILLLILDGNTQLTLNIWVFDTPVLSAIGQRNAFIFS